MTDLGNRERLAEAGPKLRARWGRRSWFVVAFWAVLAVGLALAAQRELIGPRSPSTNPAAARPPLPAYETPREDAAPHWAAFRNFAYFESAALLQFSLIRRERILLAAEAEKLKRLRALGPDEAPGEAPGEAPLDDTPPDAPEDDDPRWLGLPPAPEALLLAPLPGAGDFFDPEAPAE